MSPYLKLEFFPLARRIDFLLIFLSHGFGLPRFFLEEPIITKTPRVPTTSKENFGAIIKVRCCQVPLKAPLQAPLQVP